jgi:acyl-CoA dehydrogenase
MTDADLIAQSVDRLFAEQVDKAVRERAETGEFDRALWAQVVGLGLPAMLATEAAGGLAQPWSAAYPVLRALGHAQVPLPLAETMIAAQLLSQAGLPLPDLSAGALTLVEQSRCGALHVRTDGSGVRLSGVVHRVPWARHAQAAAVSLTDGRIALLPLAAGGVSVQPYADTAGLPVDSLLLHEAHCPAVATHPLPLALPVWTLGALARSVMMVGALEWTLAQTVRYAGERVQFGKPIGRNQAIQQNLALMAGDVAAARVAALVAAADAPQPGQGGEGGTAAVFGTAVAKVRCGEAATRGTAIAHQVHGAIGFTQEHALHFATRRLWAWRDDFGSDAWWAAELGRAAISGRATGFWPSLSGKNFAALDG